MSVKFYTVILAISLLNLGFIQCRIIKFLHDTPELEEKLNASDSSGDVSRKPRSVLATSGAVLLAAGGKALTIASVAKTVCNISKVIIPIIADMCKKYKWKFCAHVHDGYGSKKTTAIIRPIKE